MFISIFREAKAEAIDRGAVSIEGMGKGILVDGEARIGEGLIDPMRCKFEWGNMNLQD